MEVKYRIDRKNLGKAKFQKTGAGDYECLCGLKFAGRTEVDRHLNPRDGEDALDLETHKPANFTNRYKRPTK